MAIGKLRIIQIDDEISEELRSIMSKNAEASNTDFYFKVKDVTSMWVQKNDEDGSMYLLISILGVEYPLEYEEYLFEMIKEELNND